MLLREAAEAGSISALYDANRSVICWIAVVTGLSPATSKPAPTSASGVRFPIPDEAPVTSATGRLFVIPHSRTRRETDQAPSRSIDRFPCKHKRTAWRRG